MRADTQLRHLQTCKVFFKREIIELENNESMDDCIEDDKDDCKMQQINTCISADIIAFPVKLKYMEICEDYTLVKDIPKPEVVMY